MPSVSAKELLTFILEIKWRFGTHGLNGHCCGNLSEAEYRALCLAAGQLQCSMQEIAKGLGFTKSGASRLIDRLEKKGYTKRIRSLDDGRVCCVEVTPTGKKLINSLEGENEARIKRILSNIDPAMQQVISASLQSLVQAIKKET
ncbi:MAG: MarR family transcriptional regulator [Desulfobacteraceae bacterium]|nr:MAG: MarR family transcriptional regulator [Desulfobacteraceae bacterium]